MQNALPTLCPPHEIEDFCKRWKIVELSLFGSALREDFGPDSDVDLLVTFAPDAGWSLLDLARMKRDAESFIGRPVDVLTRRSIEQHPNPWTRHLILSSARTIYRAA